MSIYAPVEPSGTLRRLNAETLAVLAQIGEIAERAVPLFQQREHRLNTELESLTKTYGTTNFGLRSDNGYGDALDQEIDAALFDDVNEALTRICRALAEVRPGCRLPE